MLLYLYIYRCVAVSGALDKGETRELKCDALRSGQYVFIVNNVNEVLTLCEVQVFAIRGKNLLGIALSKSNIVALFPAFSYFVIRVNNFIKKVMITVLTSKAIYSLTDFGPGILSTDWQSLLDFILNSGKSR